MVSNKIFNLVSSAQSLLKDSEFFDAARLYYCIGDIEFKNGKYAIALSYYKDAAHYGEIAFVNDDGEKHGQISKFTMKSYGRAIECSRRLQNKKSHVNLSILAANFSKTFGDVDASKVLYDQAYSLSKNEKTVWFIESAALCAERLGMITMETKFFNESAKLYIKAGKLSRDVNNKYHFFYSAAEVFEELRQVEDAVQYYSLALDSILENIPRLVLCDPTHALLGILHLMGEENPEKALKIALRLARKIDISHGDFYHYILYSICCLTKDEHLFNDCLSKLTAFAEKRERIHIIERAEAAWLLEEFDKEKSLKILHEIIKWMEEIGEKGVVGICYLLLSNINEIKEKELLETGLNLLDYCISARSLGGYITYDPFYHRMKSRYFILKALEVEPPEKLSLIQEAINHFDKAFLVADSYAMRGHWHIYEAFKLCILGRQKRDKTLIEGALANLRNAEKILSIEPEIEFLKAASEALIHTLQSIGKPQTYEDHRERAEYFIQTACKHLRSISDYPLRKLLTRELRIAEIFVQISPEQRLSLEHEAFRSEILSEIKVTQRILKSELVSLQKLMEEIIAKLPEKKRTRKKLKDYLIGLVKGAATTSDLIGLTNVLLEISGNPSVADLAKEAIRLILQSLL